MTVRELNGDKLTELAAAHWRVPEGQPRKAFDDKLVQQLYASELGGGSRAPNAQRLSLLEISQYLEGYLVPNFSEAASAMHVLSIMMLVNEKIREGLPAWSSFSDADRFGDFFKRVLSFRSEVALSVVQRTAYLVFIINVFQSLENEMVRTLALPLVSLALWHSLSPGRLQVRSCAVLPRARLVQLTLLVASGGAGSPPAAGEALEAPAAQGSQGGQAGGLRADDRHAAGGVPASPAGRVCGHPAGGCERGRACRRTQSGLLRGACPPCRMCCA